MGAAVRSPDRHPRARFLTNITYDGAPLLEALFRDDDVRAFRPRTPRFGCSCTRERVAGALKMLGRAEVESILAELGSVGVNCEFCNRRYDFDADEARALFAAPASAVHS